MAENKKAENGLGSKMEYNNKSDNAQDRNMKKPSSPVCEGCLKWQWHGEKCWVHWENKKVCSHYEDERGNNKDGFRLAKENDDEFLL